MFLRVSEGLITRQSINVSLILRARRYTYIFNPVTHVHEEKIQSIKDFVTTYVKQLFHKHNETIARSLKKN